MATTGFTLQISLKLLLSKVRTLFAHLWLVGFYRPCINSSCTCAYQAYTWHQSCTGVCTCGVCPDIPISICTAATCTCMLCHDTTCAHHSLVPRPLAVFQCWTLKKERHWKTPHSKLAHCIYVGIKCLLWKSILVTCKRVKLMHM